MGVKEKNKKSLFIAYLCWLFGGFFGLHLFYLERDIHAFLTWSTFGGYGVGWLFDIMKIPSYVKECNEVPEYIYKLTKKMRENPQKPPFSTNRFIAATVVGSLWGQLILLAIPEDEVFGIEWSFLHWLVPFAVALGIWAVGNMGRECGQLWPSVVFAYVAYLSRWYIYDESIWLLLVVTSTAIFFDSVSKQWHRKPIKKKPLSRRITVLVVCAIIYIALWSSFIYFNGRITDSNGDEIPVHEALHHFFTSPLWTDFKQSLYDVYVYARHHGWYEIWKQIIELSDPQGEQNAYRVLDVSPTTSQSEITAKWRKLSREFHPDKVKDPDLKRAAQEKFMDIQQAYEILSNIKNKRSRKNKKSVPSD